MARKKYVFTKKRRAALAKAQRAARLSRKKGGSRRRIGRGRGRGEIVGVVVRNPEGKITIHQSAVRLGEQSGNVRRGGKRHRGGKKKRK